MVDGLDARAQWTEAARAAMVRAEQRLRLAGAVGRIIIACDPARPEHEQWWARCTVSPELGQITVTGYSSGKDALEHLAEAVDKRPREGKKRLWTPGMT